MGSLFKELCELGADDVMRTPQQLLDYKAHRFLGLTRVIRRVLVLWEPLVLWYDERLAKAEREGKEPPSVFPLARDHENLTQLLCLLEPITIVNRRGQSESANQVEVLLTLFKLRLTTLNTNSALRDYRSTKEKKMYFRPDQLTPLISNTRSLLQKAFQRNFFERYTSRQKISKCSFVLEMQLFLHPNFKNLDGVLKDVVLLCHSQEGLPRTIAEGNFGRVKHAVTNKLRALMKSVENESEIENILNFPPPPPVVFSEDLMELFADTPSKPLEPEHHRALDDARVEDELQRWIMAATTLQQAEGQIESILSYWKRQEAINTYKLLPRVARVIYAMPVSSAQIERDFGVAGRMVTPQRSSIAPHNVDMSIFLSCNREHVDVTQCARIPAAETRSHLPGNVFVPMDPDGDLNSEVLLNGYFSDDSDIADEED